MPCRGRRHSAERGALLEGLNGGDEGEPGEPVDVFDDVTAGAAPEAMEPVGDTANGQRGSGVVVERATAHQPLSAPGQLDSTSSDDSLNRVSPSNCRNVKACAAGERHSSTPAANPVAVSTSCVGTARWSASRPAIASADMS